MSWHKTKGRSEKRKKIGTSKTQQTFEYNITITIKKILTRKLVDNMQAYRMKPEWRTHAIQRQWTLTHLASTLHIPGNLPSSHLGWPKHLVFPSLFLFFPHLCLSNLTPTHTILHFLSCQSCAHKLFMSTMFLCITIFFYAIFLRPMVISWHYQWLPSPPMTSMTQNKLVTQLSRKVLPPTSLLMKNMTL
jgi:hypothetical protein